MIGNLAHSGYISSIHKDNLTPFYTTISNNEIISFTDAQGKNQNLNSLTIEADNTALYIQVLPSEYCVYIPVNGSTTIDFLKISQIKVLGNLGQKIKWYGKFY